MKMYERFIPEPVTLEDYFIEFCKHHNVKPEALQSQSREIPYPGLRRKFTHQANKAFDVTQSEIAEIVNVSRCTVSNYINYNYKKNYRTNRNYLSH